jgi:hypothetical protein
MSALDRLNRKYGLNIGSRAIGQPTQMELLGGVPSEEEQTTVLGDMGRALLGGVAAVGNVLDTPGAFLRTALAGQNPFPGVFDTDQRVSGRDLLEKAGILNANTPGLDWGDAAGFGAEVLLDPLTLLAGPVKGMSAAGKAAVEAGQILPRHTPEILKAVQEGATGLVNVGIPGIPFVSDFQPLGHFGTGDKAANVLEAIHYGRGSPLNWARGLFGTDTLGLYDPLLQKQAEVKAVETSRQAAASAAEVNKALPDYQKMKAALDRELQARGMIDEVDRANTTASLIRQSLERAGVTPEPGQLRQYLAASGWKLTEEELDAGSAAMRGLADGLANITGKTPAEEVFKRFPSLERGDLSDTLGVDWTPTRANKSMMPAGVKLSQTPEIQQALREQGYVDFQITDMTPEEQWQKVFGTVEETYRPLVRDASVTWSEVVPGEKLRKTIPGEMEVDTVSGKSFALAPPLPARYDDPFIVRSGDGKYRLFKSGADGVPSVFDNLVEAKNAAVPLMLPDPVSRVAQLRNVGSELSTTGMESLSAMGQATRDLLDSLKGNKTELTLAKAGSTLQRFLPAEHQETLAKAYGVGADAEQAISRDFANFVLHGSTGLRSDVDLPFSAMGQVLSNVWERAGQQPGLRNQIGSNTLDLFDKVLRPDDFLNAVDMARGAWLKVEREHSGVLDQLRALDGQRYTDMVSHGLNVAFLDDALIDHMARRWSGELPKREASRKKNELFGWMQLARNDALRNIPGGTGALRRMSLDTEIAGLIGPPPSKADLVKVHREKLNKLAEEKGQYLTRTYGVGEEQAPELAKILLQLDPEQVADRIPIFNRDSLADVADYLHTSDRMLAAVKSLKPMIQAISERSNGTVPLEEAWARMGLTKAGIAKLTEGTNLTPETMLDERLVTQMQRFVNSHTHRSEPHPLTNVWDAIHRSYKSLLTTPFPAKHARDLMSSLFTSWTAGAASPGAASDMLKILRGKLDEPELGEDALSLRGLLNEMITQRTFKKYGSSASELLDYAARQFSPDANISRQVFDDARGALSDAVSGGARGVLQAMNPFAGFRESLEEGAEQTARSKFLPNAIGQSFGDLNDMLLRGMHYITLRRKGWTPHAAHESVAQHLFDWSELNQFEKDYARRYATFYSWQRKNLPYQLERLIDAPGGKNAQTIRAMGDLQQEGEADAGWIPNYIRQRGGIPLGADEQGVMSYVTGNPLPIGDLNQFVVPTSGDWAKPAMVRTGQNLMSTLNPLLTLPIEQFTGDQLWSGRPLKYLHGFTGSQLLDNAIAHSPIARGLTTARRLDDDRKSIAAKLINLATGFQISQVSPEDIPKWQMVDLLDAAQAVARDNPHLKDFERIYVEPEDIQNLSPETIALLAVQMQKAKEYQQAKREGARQRVVIKARG